MDGLGNRKTGGYLYGLEYIPMSLAAIMKIPCTQPLDVIKTRMQVDTRGCYKGIIQCGATIAKSEGIRALWKGSTPMLALYSTNLISTYSIRQSTNMFNVQENFLFSIVLTTPFEVVKMRLQQQNNNHNVKYKGALHCVRTIIREETVGRLWVGFAPTLIKNIILSASILEAKNTSMKYKREEEKERTIPWKGVMAGCSVFMTGVVCSTPFDVVQTRLMSQVGSYEENKYQGMIHAFKTIYSEEGFHALFRDLLLRSIMIPSVLLIAIPLTNRFNKSDVTLKDTPKPSTSFDSDFDC